MSQEPESKEPRKQIGKHRIKIYRRTYELPVLGGDKFDELQSSIKTRSEALQRGYIVKKVRKEVMIEKQGFFGKKLVSKIVEESVKQELKFEERFQELDGLVKNYDVIIATLNEHQDEYQIFFEQLADEIREIVTVKCQEIALVEQDRLEVERMAQAEDDDDLLQIAAQQKIEILETAKTIGYAAILMLKKLDLMSVSLKKITNDQQTQKEVLSSMVKKLTVQKKAYDVQMKIKRLQAEAQELTNIALNFEDYMKKFMGSFQTLLGNVAKVDRDLSGAMQEIQQIAEMAMNQQSATMQMNDRSSQKVLDFLVASNLKKERLVDALEQAKETNSEVDFDYRLKSAEVETSLNDCLENIQAYVQFELKPILAAKDEREKIVNQDPKRYDPTAFNWFKSSENQKQKQYTPTLMQTNQSKVESSYPTVELRSSKRIDYRKLEKLLKASEWREADELTANIIGSRDTWETQALQP